MADDPANTGEAGGVTGHGGDTPQGADGAGTSGNAKLRRRTGIVFGLGLVPLLIVVGVGLTGGIGAFTFGYGKGFSYLKNDPSACANCHVMQEHFASWNRSSHHAVATCNDCHLPHHPIMKWVVKGDNGFFHSLAFTTGEYHDPIQIKPRNRKVTQGACMSCHAATVHEMMTVQRDGDTMWCVGCHTDVGHAGRRRGSVAPVPQDPPTPSESVLTAESFRTR